MIIFLYGRDGYRLKQNVDKIVSEYSKKYSGLAFSMLDLDETGEVTKLEDAIKTNSFFDEKRLVVIKNSFGEAGRLIELIKTWNLTEDKQRIFVFVENADGTQLAKKDQKLFSVLAAKPNVVKTVELLAGSKLENWLVKEIRIAGYEIEKNALKKLLDYTVDPDPKEIDPSITWRLKHETNKLTNYKSTQISKLITAADVELLVTPRVDLNIFEVVDAVANKNKFRAAKLLHNHLENDADPYYIFSMIVYQFRNLLRVKDLTNPPAGGAVLPYSEIIKKTGMNPYVVKKTYEQCRKYDPDELKNKFAKLARLDLGAKNGETEVTDGLYQFIFSL